MFGDQEGEEDPGKRPRKTEMGNPSAEAMWRKVLQLRSIIRAIEYCSEVSWEGNEDGPLLSAVEVTGYCA